MARECLTPEQAAASADQAPYGVREKHFYPGRRIGARIALVVIVGGALLAAVLGFLGGGPAERTRVRNAEAVFSVLTPRILRSGNWFETRFDAWPARDVEDLTVAIERPLWHRMSIDTLEPAAESSEFKDGAFRYSFGTVRAGEHFHLKIDGQIQPWGFRRLQGDVVLLDGERPLARVPLKVTILP